MKRKKVCAALVSNLLACLVSFVALVPFALILFNSVKSGLDAAYMDLRLPSRPLHWENFGVVIEKGKLSVSFLNSCIYTIGGVALCTLLCAGSAYVLARNRSPRNRLIYFYVVLGIAMPINYVALIRVMGLLGLMNSRLGIVLLYTAMQTPFSVFLLYGFVLKIPTELDEAAILDGCGPAGLFFRIVLPLLKPALATVVVLVFLNNWNEFMTPLYFLSSSEKWPMTLSVYSFFGMYFNDWNLVCADIVLTSLPVILVYLLGQKYIVSGMTAGAVKG